MNTIENNGFLCLSVSLCNDTETNRSQSRSLSLSHSRNFLVVDRYALRCSILILDTNTSIYEEALRILQYLVIQAVHR